MERWRRVPESRLWRNGVDTQFYVHTTSLVHHAADVVIYRNTAGSVTVAKVAPHGVNPPRGTV